MTLLPRLILAAIAIGCTAWSTYLLTRWTIGDKARAILAVESLMRELNASADFWQVVATAEAEADCKAHVFDGRVLLSVDWDGPRMNANGGSC